MIDRNDDDEVEITEGVDTDHDGHPDTLVLPDPSDLSLVADTDRDGLVDLLLRIGPDGAVTTTDLHGVPTAGWAIDTADEVCYDPLWPDRL
jgi:hypothetical protein